MEFGCVGVGGSMMGLASESGWILRERMEMLGSHAVRRRGGSCATERGEGLCNPRVARRFRRLLPCVVEMDGDGGLWTVDGASASSMARVTCREEHLKDPERHLNLSAAERRFPAGRVCAFVFACES